MLLHFWSLYTKQRQDPMHRWIGTYNLFRIYLLRFFKWLYYPDFEPNKRPKPTIVENLARLKRKEESIYKPSDLWTQQDDLLFLKYCPSKRDKCYHAMSRDLSCRPHEIFKLKIRVLYSGQQVTTSMQKRNPIFPSHSHHKDIRDYLKKKRRCWLASMVYV
jgi:hypothetical protein